MHTGLPGKRDLARPALELTGWAGLAITGVLVALLGIVGLIGDYPSTSDHLLDFVGRLGPVGIVEHFRGPVEQLVRDDLLAACVVGLGALVTVPSASEYLRRLRVTAGRLGGGELDGRRSLRAADVAALLGSASIAALVVIAIALTGAPARAAVETLQLGDRTLMAWNFGKWLLVAAGLTALLVILYRTALPLRAAGMRAVSVGQVLALGAWALVAAGLAFYVSHFGSVNETYGGLGATFITLLWLTMLSVLYYVTPRLRLDGFGALMPGLAAALAGSLVAAAALACAVTAVRPLSSVPATLGILLLALGWLWCSHFALLSGAALNLARDRQLMPLPPEWRPATTVLELPFDEPLMTEHVVEPGNGMSPSKTDDSDATGLARLVATALGDEIAHRGMWSVLPGGASEAPALLSDLECDLNDWGFAYGVAWAVARTRFPLAQEAEIAARALEAATIVFRDYCGGVDWPQRLAARDADRMLSPRAGGDNHAGVL